MWYIKKPISIEAIQWTGNNYEEIKEFMGNTPSYVNSSNELIIPTLEGNMHAIEGSYIIRGIQGEYYPCRKDIFEEIYEEEHD